MIAVLTVAQLAWATLAFTVPPDTTYDAHLGKIATMVATCAAQDSAERPLPLYADSLGHPYTVKPSGTVQRVWVRMPADGQARMVWVRAIDSANQYFDGVFRGNVGARSNAVAIIVLTSSFAPADTLVVSTRTTVRDGRHIVYTVPTKMDPALHIATFAYGDTFPPALPPFTMFMPAAVKYEEAVRLGWQGVTCPLFGYYVLRGMRLVCPAP